MIKLSKIMGRISPDSNPLKWLIDDNKAMIQNYENRSRRMEGIKTDMSEKQVARLVREYSAEKGLSVYEASLEIKLQKRDRYMALTKAEAKNE